MTGATLAGAVAEWLRGVLTLVLLAGVALGLVVATVVVLAF